MVIRVDIISINRTSSTRLLLQPPIAFALQSFPQLHTSKRPKMTVTYLVALIAVLGAGLPMASAGCFTSGDYWSDKDNARYHAERACLGYDGQSGAFQGWFAPYEEKWVCVSGPGNQRFDFRIKNENYNEGFDLDDFDCRDKLWNEISCNQGGRSTVSGWTFT
jgi:hypothetical protein